ncbi:MAG: TOBE domain-containing protein [Azonexus sp.]|nr:TOBE domain-containing protein [Azonexus sp.]
MPISARNQLAAKVSNIRNGTVNAEIELTLAGGDTLVAIVTERSVKDLGLTIGKDVVALIKAPWVILTVGPQPLKFSARNRLTGRIARVREGAVNTEVTLALPGGAAIVAVVDTEAVTELELKVGVEATALIKASHIVLGVSA